MHDKKQNQVRSILLIQRLTIRLGRRRRGRHDVTIIPACVDVTEIVTDTLSTISVRLECLEGDVDNVEG